MYNPKFHREHIHKLPLRFRLNLVNDSYFIASYVNPNKFNNIYNTSEDHQGAFMYVVAVILLWGLSIVLLIASTVRKNRLDKNVSLYLKEIQAVRNRSDRQKILQVVVNMENNGDILTGLEEATKEIKRISQKPVVPKINRFIAPFKGRKIFIRVNQLLEDHHRDTERKCSLAVPEIFVEDEDDGD